MKLEREYVMFKTGAMGGGNDNQWFIHPNTGCAQSKAYQSIMIGQLGRQIRATLILDSLDYRGFVLLQ